jgi:anti-sigma B factor antagonist
VEQLMTVVQRSGEWAVVVEVHGEVDMMTAPRFQRALVDALRGSAGRVVVVDLSRVDLLSSAGLSVLSRARAGRAALKSRSL